MIYVMPYVQDDNGFSLYFTDAFYEQVSKWYTAKGSFFDILPRLFGLLPQDFYHYIGARYHAYFIKSKNIKNHISMRFKQKEDFNAFAMEVEHRLTYCINRGDFK